MKEYIRNFILESGNLSPEQLIRNMLAALCIGLLIYGCYRMSYTDVTYSRRFNASLVMMALVTTIVVAVISNNVALSLGMVGALSIVRFRTAVKDPRDSTFIYWSLVVGICCGTSQYLVAAIGSAFIFIFLLIAGHIRTDGKYLLIIRCERSIESQVESLVYNTYQNIHLRVKNTTGEQNEYIYELSERRLIATKNHEQQKSLTDRLYALQRVTSVNLIEQNADMSR